MKLSHLKHVIKEELRKIKIQKLQERNPNITGPYGGPATSGPGDAPSQGRGYSEKPLTPVGTPKDTGGGGQVSACVQDHGCCDWSIPIIKYIYGIEVKWEACCYGNGTVPC